MNKVTQDEVEDDVVEHHQGWPRRIDPGRAGG